MPWAQSRSTAWQAVGHAAAAVAAAGTRRLDRWRDLGAADAAAACRHRAVTLRYVTVTSITVMPTDTNPFVYGEVVPASAFVDREAELDRLTGDLLAGQKVFLISPRRYGKSSLVSRALDARCPVGRPHRRRHGQQLQLLRRVPRGLRPGACLGRNAARSRPRVAARHARRPCVPKSGSRPTPTGSGQLALSFPSARSEQDVSHLAAEVFALPGADCGGATAQDGDRARRVPGDRRVQRRQRRARAARRRPAPAHCRLRVLGLGTGADGAHARAQPPVLQGRTGDAARPNPRRPLRRIPRGALPRHAASSPRPASAPRSSSSPATSLTTCSDSRTRCGTMCGRRARRRRAWTICTRRSSACSASTIRCSRACGSG